MNQEEFIRYIGDYRIHDGIIDTIMKKEEIVEVEIRSTDQERTRLIFYDVIEVKENKPQGMMLYAIAEMGEKKENHRHYSFVNWDEKGEAYLEIVAKSFEIK